MTLQFDTCRENVDFLIPIRLSVLSSIPHQLTFSRGDRVSGAERRQNIKTDRFQFSDCSHHFLWTSFLVVRKFHLGDLTI